jgi:hypothetical protein
MRPYITTPHEFSGRDDGCREGEDEQEPRDEGCGSRPISRVLSRTAIHLGCTSPCTSSDLPGNPCGPHVAAMAACSPIWSCSGWGLPCRRVLPPARCALTAPFHPCRPTTRERSGLAVYFLWHFPWAHAPQALPGTLPCGARTFLPPTAPAGTAGERLPGRLPKRSYYRPSEPVPAARSPCNRSPSS